MLATVLTLAMLSPTIFVDSEARPGGEGSSARPFRTLDEALRRLDSLSARPYTLRLRGRFTAPRGGWELAGSGYSGVTLESWGSRPPILSAGTPVGAWRVQKLGARTVWAADIPKGVRYRSLWFENGPRKIARTPDTGFFRLAGLLDGAENGEWNKGQSRARFNPAQLGPFARPTDVDLVFHHFWIQSRLGIATVNSADRVVAFDRPSTFRLTDDYTPNGAQYVCENVEEALDSPGEFVIRQGEGEVLYVPRPGEKPGRAWVSDQSVILRVKDADDVVLRNLEFRHAEYSFPAGWAGDFQAAFSVPAAVQLENVKNAVVEDCSARDLGTYGFQVSGERSRGNAFRRCSVRDTGAGGFKLLSDTMGSVIADCTVERGGRIHGQAVGIYVANSGGNRILRNRIHDLFYTGISVGWTWGYAATKTQNNEIAYNDVSKIGQGLLSDMGGFYSLGDATGTRLHHNRFRDIDSRGYGGWGIYFDEGTSNLVAEFNLVENTKSGGFHQHYGRDNVLRNNVFRFARTEGQIIRTRLENHNSFTFERNVVEFAGTDALGSNWDKNLVSRSNVWWRTDGPPTFKGKSLADWQALGWEAGSLVATPGIRITSRGVEVLPGSAAAKVGFKPFSLEAPR